MERHQAVCHSVCPSIHLPSELQLSQMGGITRLPVPWQSSAANWNITMRPSHKVSKFLCACLMMCAWWWSSAHIVTNSGIIPCCWASSSSLIISVLCLLVFLCRSMSFHRGVSVHVSLCGWLWKFVSPQWGRFGEKWVCSKTVIIISQPINIVKAHLVEAVSLGKFTQASLSLSLSLGTFQYVQRQVMQPTITFWNTHLWKCNGGFFCSTKEKNAVYLCTYVCVHACGQSPTVPSQPLRTSGDVWRTKDTMKAGREKRRTERKGSVKFPLQQRVWMTFVELHFLTNMCLQDYYQSTDTNVAKFNMRSKQIWTWIETGLDVF